jgi:ubiquinone/menaquinone biosynthesis C-methylase UbiE
MKKGDVCMTKREVGHTFLARIGKKRLRPGGKLATQWLISQANITSNSKVLEVACNMGTTMIEVAERYNCSVIGVDLDKHALEQAKKNISAHNLQEQITVQHANATKLPFPDNHFDVVINEAMLTMLQHSAKEKAISEYYRVLKPGGCLLTHDVMLTKKDEDVLKQMRNAINVNAQPLTKVEWDDLLSSTFSSITHISGKMTLMSPKGMITDEGLLGTIKIIKNALKKENKQMFLKMFNTFRKKKDILHFIAICSRK